MATIGTWLERLDRWIPFSLGAKWDNSGLLIGDRDAEARGVVVSLDLTCEAIQEAHGQGCNVLMVHHPPLFPKVSIKKLGPGHPVYEAVRSDIHVIALHSSFDQGGLEVGERVCQGLQIKPRGRFFDQGGQGCLKLQTFVPVDAVERVREALFAAGAGRIGNYEHCSFGVLGKGSFKGGAESQPMIGRPGHFEEVEEVRLEVLLSASLHAQVEEALVRSHPYEEVARDYVPVLPQKILGVYRGVGYGVWGECDAVERKQLYRRISACFGVEGFQVFSGGDGPVTKVGFTPGSGKAFLEYALEMGLEVYVTGEVDYHAARHAAAQGLTVVQLGHAESECFFKPIVEEWLQQW